MINGPGYCHAALQLREVKYETGHGIYAEYDFYIFNSGPATLNIYALPLFAKDKEHGTRFGIQIDDAVTFFRDNYVKEYSMEWANNVIRNSAIDTKQIQIRKPGKHTLKLFCVDPGMVIQKMVVDPGGMKESSPGPAITKMK